MKSYLQIVLTLLLLYFGNSLQNVVKRDLDTVDLFAHPDEPFLREGANLSHINISHLLEVNFINKSVHHYHSKAKQVQSSLQDRINDLILHIPSRSSLRNLYSPEFRQKLNETFFKLIETLELSPLCLASFNLIRLDLLKGKLWPLKFIDAIELMPSGLLDGVFSSFGEYESCLHIESPDFHWNGIRGKYCLAKIKLPFLSPTYEEQPELSSQNATHSSLPPNQMRALFEHLKLDYDEFNNQLKVLQMVSMFKDNYYRFGVCFPSTCTSLELQRAANKFLEPLQGLLQLEIENECSVLDEKMTLNNYQLVSLLILGFFSLLVLLSTTYEYFCIIKTQMKPNKAQHSPYIHYLLTFSAWSNTVSLFTIKTEKANSAHRLNVIGIVVLTFIFGEIIGRSYIFTVILSMINIKRAQNGLTKEYFTAKKFIFLRSAIFAASTYVLAFSAILAFNLSTNKSVVFKLTTTNYLKYIVSRWLSYARRMVGPILLLYLMPLAGDGPIWHYFEPLFTESCKHNLWSSFLFISNYEDTLYKVCNQPTLILSAMFYLSLFSPLLLAAFKRKMSTIVLLVGLILLGTFITTIPKLFFNLPVAPQEISRIASPAQAKHSFIHYLYATDQLLVPFTIGTFVGYVLKCKPNLDLGNQLTQYIIWVGMLLLPALAAQWNEEFNPFEGNFTQFNFNSWFVLGKVMWSAGFGWIVFACATGRGFGPLSQLLSLPLLQPLSKLAFGVYLNHITILAFRQLTKKTIAPLTHTEILMGDIADIVIAFAISYVFYILIEQPFYHWIKIVINLEVEKGDESLPTESDHEIEEMHLKNNNLRFSFDKAKKQTKL